MKQDLKTKIEYLIGNGIADENELIFQLKNLLEEIEAGKNPARESRNIAGLVTECLAPFRNGTGGPNYIKTGFADFDKAYNGFLEGELVVFGARPGMGKTLLLINLAVNISEKIPVTYISYDLSAHSLSNRIISAITKMHYPQLLSDPRTREIEEALNTAETKLQSSKMIVNDSPYHSMINFKSLCKRHIDEHGAKVIIVDCLQLMSVGRFRGNRETEVSFICRELKNFARENNVCIIASSQLNRSVEYREGRKPQLTDLRESGAIEQYADKVIFLHRPEYYGISADEEGNSTRRITELIMAKNRNGAVGDIIIKMNECYTGFVDFDGYQNNFTYRGKRLIEIFPDMKDELTPF